MGLIQPSEVNCPASTTAGVCSLGLLPWVLWPLRVYNIPLTPVERMEQKINVKLGHWLGVPCSFNKNALYAASFKLSLPSTSLVGEFKVGKGRLLMMLKESPDTVISDHAPELNTGRE